MIVKNEELFLDISLKGVCSFLRLDDMVVVDTGSTDRTKEVARKYGARVVDFKWCDDFSAARNFAASKAKHDWILVLDADEEVTGSSNEGFEGLFTNTQTVGLIEVFDLVEKLKGRATRVYNRNYYSYKGNIHEQLRSLNEEPVLLTTNVGISTVHHGYLPEHNKVMGKLERNAQMLEKELQQKPDDPYLLYQLGKSYFCNNRDLTKACEYFERVLSAGVDINIGYSYNLVECYGYALINTGQYEKALKLRETFAPVYDDNIQFRFLSAHIYQNNGFFQEAVESYESCIGVETFDEKGINSFLSYYNIGVILECVGMIEDAIVMYKNCGDYEPAKQRLADLAKG